MKNNDVFTAQVTHWKYYDANRFQFLGTFVDKNVGDIHFTAGEKGVYGFFNVNDRSYEIIGTDTRDVSILVEHHKSDKKCGTIGFGKDKIEEDQGTQSRTTSCGAGKVRVLAVYTAHSLAAHGGSVSAIEQKVMSGIDLFNNSNMISGVVTPESNLEYAGIVSTSYVEYLRNSNIDNSNYLTLFNNLRAAAKILKIQYQADILVCMGDHNWIGPFGIAAAIPATQDDDGYAVVEADIPNVAEVFAHELGHLLGGRHIDDPAAGDGHAHQYFVLPCSSCSPNSNTPKRHTLMTQGGVTNSTLALRWSNPNITDGFSPTGIVSTSNVTRNINANGIAVASLREIAGPSATLTGPNAVYNMGTHTYYLTHMGCPDPSGYMWHTSSNGYTWTQVGSIATSHVQFFIPGMGSMFYVRCTVSYPDRPSAYYFKTTQLYINPYRIHHENEMNVKNLKAWPNPIEDGFVINIPNSNNTGYKIECTDKDGRSHPLTYTILENNQTDGYTNIMLQVPNLDMGLYTVRIIADNKVYTSKFIKP